MWFPVTVTKVTGPISYQVITEDGVTLRRHVDHLRYRYSSESAEEYSDREDREDVDDSDDWPLPSSTPTPEEEQPLTQPPPASVPLETSSRPRGRPRKGSTHIPSRIPVRRSTRSRPPVDHYSPQP